MYKDKKYIFKYFKRRNTTMRKSALIRNGRHQRPMFSALSRWGIGTSDKYGRGIWVNHADLPAIEQAIKADPTHFVFYGRDYCNGSNRHNQVEVKDFIEVFDE